MLLVAAKVASAALLSTLNSRGGKTAKRLFMNVRTYVLYMRESVYVSLNFDSKTFVDNDEKEVKWKTYILFLFIMEMILFVHFFGINLMGFFVLGALGD